MVPPSWLPISLHQGEGTWASPSDHCTSLPGGSDGSGLRVSDLGQRIHRGHILTTGTGTARTLSVTSLAFLSTCTVHEAEKSLSVLTCSLFCVSESQLSPNAQAFKGKEIARAKAWGCEKAWPNHWKGMCCGVGACSRKQKEVRRRLWWHLPS